MSTVISNLVDLLLRAAKNCEDAMLLFACPSICRKKETARRVHRYNSGRHILGTMRMTPNLDFPVSIKHHFGQDSRYTEFAQTFRFQETPMRVGAFYFRELAKASSRVRPS